MEALDAVAARAWFQENASRFGGQLLFDEPLSRHTYYRIGGPAAIYAAPKSAADLQWLFEGIVATGARFFVLGAGSNLLVSDAGFPGLIIRSGKMNLELGEMAGAATPSGSARVRTGASVAISTLLRRASVEGWAGFERLSGVPGTVGGAVYMNAGTHLGETGDLVRRVEAFSFATGAMQVFEGPELRFEYRKNLFLPRDGLIWAAEWEVRREEPVRVKAVIDETLARRKATQPVDLPSCGSVFKNPRASGMSAWQVMDKLGLRGHRIGGAQFSEKHSNFIVNTGGALAADVRGLIELAKARARAELGVLLEEEVIFLE